MYIVGWRPCKCHPFTFNPFCFQSVKPVCVRCWCIIRMLLGLYRRTAKRGMCVCPQESIYASRAHSQYTHLLTVMLCYLAQYSTTCTLEGCLQYYSVSSHPSIFVHFCQHDYHSWSHIPDHLPEIRDCFRCGTCRKIHTHTLL